jgi:hypothetical protein
MLPTGTKTFSTVTAIGLPTAIKQATRLTTSTIAKRIKGIPAYPFVGSMLTLGAMKSEQVYEIYNILPHHFLTPSI